MFELILADENLQLRLDEHILAAIETHPVTPAPVNFSTTKTATA